MTHRGHNPSGFPVGLFVKQIICERSTLIVLTGAMFHCLVTSEKPQQSSDNSLGDDKDGWFV